MSLEAIIKNTILKVLKFAIDFYTCKIIYLGWQNLIVWYITELDDQLQLDAANPNLFDLIITLLFSQSLKPNIPLHISQHGIQSM